MKYRELAKRLKSLECEEYRSAKGSHVVWRNRQNDQKTIIPMHGHKDLAPGTIRAIIRDLGISRKQFGPIK